jgi:hypothetical protein
VIEPLAKLPAALPGLLMGVRRSRAVEDTFPVDSAEVGECVAQCPALLKSCPKCFDLGVLAEPRVRKIVGVVVFVIVRIHLMAFRNHCDEL